jgi:hypothetical protein
VVGQFERPVPIQCGPFRRLVRRFGGGRLPSARVVSPLSQNPDECDGLRRFRAGPARRLRPAAAVRPRAGGGGAEVIRPPRAPERGFRDRARHGLPAGLTAGSVSSASRSPVCLSLIQYQKQCRIAWDSPRRPLKQARGSRHALTARTALSASAGGGHATAARRVRRIGSGNLISISESRCRLTRPDM